MEWCIGNAIEDFVVPKDEEMFDCLSSPGWTLWGKKFESPNSPKKLTAAGVEECLFGGDSYYSEVEQLGATNVCRGSGQAFCQESAYSDEYPDVQVNEFSRFNEADDIFLHSLFKADVCGIYGADNSDNTVQNSSQNDAFSVINLFGEGDHVRDCTYNVEDDYPFPEVKDPECEICVSADPSNECKCINEEEICLEESVLLELQRSMLQLAEDTRSCFRDSLYRLAENSRQQVSCSQDTVEALEDYKPTTSSAQSRSGETNAKVSNTNAVDRTVATLLFNTMKSPSLTGASKLDRAGKVSRKGRQFSPYQPNSSNSSLCSGDAEVPSFGSMNQPIQP